MRTFAIQQPPGAPEDSQSLTDDPAKKDGDSLISKTSPTIMRTNNKDQEDMSSGSSTPTLRVNPSWKPVVTPELPPLRDIGFDIDSILDRLLSVRGGRPGNQVQLLEEELLLLCKKARDIFISQPML